MIETAKLLVSTLKGTKQETLLGVFLSLEIVNN